MKKIEVVVAALGGLLVGIIIGFLIAPIKKGFEIGNNSGNTTNIYGDENDEDFEIDEIEAEPK